MFRSLSVGLVFLAGASCALRAETADIESLRNLRTSDRWSVDADGTEATVYTTLKPPGCDHQTHRIGRMSFCTVVLPSNKETLSLTIRAATAQRLEIRPNLSAHAGRFRGESVQLTVRGNQHLVLLADGSWEDALVLSIQNAISSGPVAAEEAEHYFGPGIHRIGRGYRLRSGETAHLGKEAIVVGSFWIEDATDVRITGQGILYGGDTPHREGYRVIGGRNASDVNIEGITIANSPGWIVSFWGESERLSVRNVVMAGNFRYNTDGVQTGANGLRVEDCFIQTNDDNFSLNGRCRNALIQGNTLWNLYNGGVFMLGWGRGRDFQLRDIHVRDCVVIRAGGCCPQDYKAPFSLKIAGRGGAATDVLFERVVVEELLPEGNWIDLQAGDAESARLANWRFKDCSIDSAWRVAGEIRGPRTGVPIEHIRFENLRIAGQLVGGLDTAGLKVERAREVTFDSAGDSEGGAVSADADHLPLATPMIPGASWSAYNPGACRVFLEAGPHGHGAQVFRVTDRTSPRTGVQQVVTDLILTQGHGRYELGAVVRGLNEELPVRVALVVEDDDGVHYFSTSPFVARPAQPTEHAEVLAVQWRNLRKATWTIESASESLQDFLVVASTLNPVP